MVGSGIELQLMSYLGPRPYIAARVYVDVSGSSYLGRPCECLGSGLSHGSKLISEDRTASWLHWTEWSVLPPEVMVTFRSGCKDHVLVLDHIVVEVCVEVRNSCFPKGHTDTYGLGWNLWPCWFLMTMLVLKP